MIVSILLLLLITYITLNISQLFVNIEDDIFIILSSMAYFAIINNAVHAYTALLLPIILAYSKPITRRVLITMSIIYTSYILFV